jgi:hypothetical protein
MTEINSSTPPSKERLTSRPRWALRLLLALLVALALVAAIGLLAPGLVLQLLSFAPQGDVETFWEIIEQAESVESIPERDGPPQDGGVPRRLPEALIARQPTASPTALPPTPTEVLTATPAAATEPPATVTPIPPTLTPAPTGTVNPYADWFAEAAVPSGVMVTGSGLTLGLQANDTFASALWFGTSIDGNSLGIVEFPESAIPNMCAKVFNGCRSDRYRIDRVDFRPGGLMVYGSINLGVLWQSLGVALLLDEDKRSLRVAGVIINDTVYQAPTSGPIASLLNDLTVRGNAALAGLRVQGGGYDLPLTELFFDDERFIAVLG